MLLLALTSAVPRDSRPYFIVPILVTPLTWSKLHYNRQLVGQSVLVSGAQFFTLLEIFFWRVAVCNLLLLLVLASAVPLGPTLCHY
jgi:hypothetical protein